ncbi:hypothetical protein HAX54_018686 [Datura stramonium]|uniref:Plant methyltransferase dimerisation domain-containing protein n=1 Tax=Datura stramonium TaxID=4076 RepID=A0ABS8UN07_DATST|nr:hypothetical protein [Datura stramonium]
MENAMEKVATIVQRLAIMELANMDKCIMSLNAVVKLNGSGDAENLQRILRMLTSYGVFEEHVVDDGSQRSDGREWLIPRLVTKQAAPPGRANEGVDDGS